MENLLVSWLIAQIIDSFETKGTLNVGLPLGNLTSQLLINVYMNEFDQFVKRELRAKYYIRYCDDFVILSENKIWLEEQIALINSFLEKKLKLKLHPEKVFVKTFCSGVDFLGWVNFSYHRVLRTSTKKRMIKNIKHRLKPEIITSYTGLLSHGNTRRIFVDYFI